MAIEPIAAHPTVSICTVTYNRPRLLTLLALLVCAQEYPPELLEWVVVDDSSVEDQPDFSAAEQAGITVRWHRLPARMPLGAKRNLCHELASGEVLVLMDDDDYYPPSRVPDAVAALQERGCLVVGCPRLPLLLLPEGSRWLSPALELSLSTAATLAYRRAFLKDSHQFDPAGEVAEELSFLEGFEASMRQLDPFRTLICIGHGGNTVDKRLWIARSGQLRFERLSASAAGFPPDAYVSAYCAALGLVVPAPEAAAAADAPGEVPPWRVAVITPYHHESLAVLERCHRSVRAQGMACTHVLVADGPGYAELDGWDCRHLVLGVGHADHGNTPRSIGALLAINEGFSCIAFLDADHWWDPGHIEAVLAAQAAGACSVVFAERRIVFPDGRYLTELPEEDRTHHHAVTSAMVLFEPAFRSLALWCQMPSLLAPQGDRVVFSHLMATERCGWVTDRQPTVFFETWEVDHFLAAGLLPPATARFLQRHPDAIWGQVAEQFRQRSPTPVFLNHDLSAAAKPRLDLVTILGPARSGGTLLQSGLCRHFSYFGFPENHFLAHLVSCCGPDHRLRHDGAALQRALAGFQPQLPHGKAHDLRPLGLEQAISANRSYTLLEAYFRVVQALIPPEVKAFARSWHYAQLLERSCTLPLVADVLFSCLPSHHAVLMLRHPLAQIASVRRQQLLYPEQWSYAGESAWLLAEVYLRSLAGPLAAARAGQLHLVLFDQLVAQPERVLEEVSCFLGLSPNILLALETMPNATDLAINQVQQQQWQHQVEALATTLLHAEPWKGRCLMGMPGTPISTCSTPVANCIDSQEQQRLEQLFAPVCEVLRWLACRIEQPDLPPPAVEPSTDTSLEPQLALLAAEVAQGLVRHASATPAGRE